MNGIFNADGPIFRVLARIADLIILSILWTVTSIRCRPILILHVDLIVGGVGVGTLAEITHSFRFRLPIGIIIVAAVAIAVKLHIVHFVGAHRRGIGLCEHPCAVETGIVEIVGAPARRW